MPFPTEGDSVTLIGHGDDSGLTLAHSHRSRMRALVLRRFAHVLLCAGPLGGAACAGGDAGRGGTVIIGAGRDVQTLFPPAAASSPDLPIAGLLFEKLADIGPDLNTIGDAGFLPRLAERWEWSPDSLRITFHLNPRAKWHDGHPVRAADVRFAFLVNTDSVVASRYAKNLRATVDSVSVNDTLTVTAWFRQRTPEQFNDLVYVLQPLPHHLLGQVPHDSLGTSAFVHAPVGNGPFRFLRWEPSARRSTAIVSARRTARSAKSGCGRSLSPSWKLKLRKK